MAAKSNLTNMALVLTAVCLVCAAILGVVYVVTADVEMQKRYEEVGFTGILLKPVTVATIGPILEGCEGRR